MGREATSRQGGRKGDFLAGKYLLEDCLGIGGMGEVYRATNVSLGRKVAIKVLSPENIESEDDVLRFLREARAAAAIRHPNVVDVIDVARDDDGTPFIVQELLAGEDLERYLRTRDGRVSWAEALEIMIPVADAVAAAHAETVVHRDLKPANIFLSRERNKITPKVLDFGACLFPTIGERSAKEARLLIGTPHYMAPEQITSKRDVDTRSDVWALGIILYEMIVGETPFEAEDMKEVLRLVKSREVPSVLDRFPSVPIELDALIARCTKRDRLARYKDAGELHADLQAVRQTMRGAPASSRAKTLLERDEEPAAQSAVVRPPPKSKNRLLTLNSPTSEPPPSTDFDLEIKMPPLPEPATPPAASTARTAALPRPAEPEPLLELAVSPSRTPPPMAASTRAATTSSLPPVLDPRAFGKSSTPPPPAAVPREELTPPVPPASARASRPDFTPAPSSAALPAPTSATTLPGPRPPAVSVSDLGTSRRRAATPAETWRLAALVVVPAVVGLVVARFVPAIGRTVGGALRGDSPIASGAMAVVALVVAAVLGARALFGQEKTRTLYVAATGSILFGIVMIIVTFSASEAAELGVPASMAGLSTLVAPIAPLALAVAAGQAARASWADSYARGEAIRNAVIASVLLFVGLALSPIGVARSGAPSAPTHHSGG